MYLPSSFVERTPYFLLTTYCKLRGDLGKYHTVDFAPLTFCLDLPQNLRNTLNITSVCSMEASPNKSRSSVKNKWDIVSFPLLKHINFHYFLLTALWIRYTSTSMQSTNRYDDRGLPCRNPCSGLKESKRVLFRRTDN